ncbi:TonB-dependent receptor [Flammeovirga sp. EKP202]|uniref:SusC/RagA family TonB-linked outer membrane protein n=1 Tax=Flammeovirga sp. EKP202 TaxID=2770592 RepID=UPI00165FF223|nr:TonB-dependent receptor [Flammeovirga sp. EKP202]MBD0401520.1 TonB-dependent receptor [Flammeovirga sp. EKP202]
MKHIRLIFTAILLFSISLAYSQDFKIEGEVIGEADGLPIPGVTVFIKGTTHGTVTNLHGKYSILLTEADKGKVLVFNHIGMINQEHTIGDRTTLNVSMASELEELEEVTVIGYSSTSKKLLTSSLQSVDSETLQDLPVATLDAALAGQASGVQINSNSGTPGSALSVRVRGVGSVNAANQPLYVIDGIPVITENSSQVSFSGQTISALSDLSPSDIESIRILKDGTEASIYGARGANGVVEIITKRGASGKTKITFNAFGGVQQVYKRLDLLNKQQWFDYKNDQLGIEKYTQEYIDNFEHDTDWQNEIFQNAPIASYDLSLQGGGEKTSFYLSGSYFDQKGVVKGSGYDRSNLRANIDHHFSDKIKMGTSLQFGMSENNRIEGDQSLNAPLPNALSLPAIYPVYNEDGSYNEDGPYANPVAIANESINKAYTYRGLGNAYLDIAIINDLTFRTQVGFDYYNLREHSYDPVNTRQGASYNGLGFSANNTSINSTINATLQYVKTINDHRFDVMAGFSSESYENRSNYIRAQNFSRPEFEYITSASEIIEADSYGLDRGLNSFFTKINYSYANKYIFAFSARRDGSSKFGTNNRYGTFPSASVAWRIVEENFMKDISAISDFKIRGSYGLTGNDAIGDFRYQALYSSGADYNGQPGISPTQLPNEDLKWETVKQANFGIDLGLWGNRFTMTTDIYQKMTTDMLLSRPLPPTSGFSSVISNIGEMKNQGIEVLLSYEIFRKKDFNWKTSLNVSTYRNEVLKLYNGQPIDNIGRGNNRIEEGEPISIFYGYKVLGVDSSTGDLVFKDVNGDGEITSDDRTKIGNPHPDFYGGFTNTLNYKNFDLSIFFQYSVGNDIYNGTRVYLESMKGEDNQTTAILDRWRQPGDITDIPRATANDPNNNNRASSRFVEDGSYIRLKNVTLGYTLPRVLTKKAFIERMRVYVSGQNLFTLTNYSGMDPEVNYAGDDGVRMGTDFFTYPNARVFTAGLNVSF